MKKYLIVLNNSNVAGRPFYSVEQVVVLNGAVSTPARVDCGWFRTPAEAMKAAQEQSIKLGLPLLFDKPKKLKGK